MQYADLEGVELGTEMRDFAYHYKPVTCMAISSNQKFLISCGLDEILNIWDLETGKWVNQLRDDFRSVNCVCFSPDQQYFAVTGSNNHTIQIASFDT